MLCFAAKTYCRKAKHYREKGLYIISIQQKGFHQPFNRPIPEGSCFSLLRQRQKGALGHLKRLKDLLWLKLIKVGSSPHKLREQLILVLKVPRDLHIHTTSLPHRGYDHYPLTIPRTFIYLEMSIFVPSPLPLLMLGTAFGNNLLTQFLHMLFSNASFPQRPGHTTLGHSL